MAIQINKQRLANLIQSLSQTVKVCQSMYGDNDLEKWAIEQSLFCQQKIKEAKDKLYEKFDIDYDGYGANEKIIKEGSEVEVLVNHMDGMKGGKAIVKSYSMPAMLSDITMTDGIKMNSHKWLTNDEIKLK